MNLLAVVPIRGIHIQGVDMEKQLDPIPFNDREILEPWIDKDQWLAEEAAEFLALGQRLNIRSKRKQLEEDYPLPEFNPDNPDLDFPGKREWAELWDIEGAYHHTLELTRSAIHPVTGAAPTSPAHWCEWAKTKGYTTDHIECHLRERDDTPPSIENGGQEDEQTPTATAKNFHTPPPEKKLFTPDNRRVTTKDTSLAPITRLITQLFQQIGDDHEAIWRELVRLASTNEGRAKYGFLVGVEGDKLQKIVFHEKGGEDRMEKSQQFKNRMYAIRKKLKD